MCAHQHTKPSPEFLIFERNSQIEILPSPKGRGKNSCRVHRFDAPKILKVVACIAIHENIVYPSPAVVALVTSLTTATSPARGEVIVYPSPTNVSAHDFADICCPLPSGEVVCSLFTNKIRSI